MRPPRADTAAIMQLESCAIVAAHVQAVRLPGSRSTIVHSSGFQRPAATPIVIEGNHRLARERVTQEAQHALRHGSQHPERALHCSRGATYRLRGLRSDTAWYDSTHIHGQRHCIPSSGQPTANASRWAAQPQGRTVLTSQAHPAHVQQLTSRAGHEQRHSTVHMRAVQCPAAARGMMGHRVHSDGG